MTVFLDTSVLVPVFLADHPHHGASIELFSTCQPQTASCAAHSLAEVYSTLTRLPAPYRASPIQAVRCVEQIAARLRLVCLDAAEYLAAIQSAAAQDIAGGTVYDFLIAACALRSCADRIYTWNQRDFERFGKDVGLRLTAPST